MPLVSIDWHTPYDMFGRNPCYENLRVIGCLCYVATLKRGRDKLDARGVQCVLLGYPMNQKGRDVSLFEDNFPCKESDLGNAKSSTKQQLRTEEDHMIMDPMIDIDPSPNNTLSNPTPDSDPLPITHEVSPTNEVSLNDPPEDGLRRPGRRRELPSWTSDYVMAAKLTSQDALLKNPSFMSQLMAIPEPLSYNTGSWEAMRRELQALEENGTWELTELPPRKRAIGSKWVTRW
ncbi:hypothetical protein V2J09_022827 [Rumex salicifolius]